MEKLVVLILAEAAVVALDVELQAMVDQEF
jgi:hypothetical protein